MMGFSAVSRFALFVSFGMPLPHRREKPHETHLSPLPKALPVTLPVTLPVALPVTLSVALPVVCFSIIGKRKLLFVCRKQTDLPRSVPWRASSRTNVRDPVQWM
jgi:hypothetical protein